VRGPPNILIVCTDQQWTDTLGCYGSDFVQMQAFYLVARRGTRYDRAYTASAVCAPSWAPLLSSQYAMRHGVWSTGVNTGDETRLPSHRLARAGYQTALVGTAHFEAYIAGPDRSRESVAGHSGGYGTWIGPFYGFQTALLAPGHANYGIPGHYGAWVTSTATARSGGRRTDRPSAATPTTGICPFSCTSSSTGATPRGRFS
jgi:uncharacterized sulfatase